MRLLGYAANRAHHSDVGGATPGSMTLSRHIDEEGFRIEPQLLYSQGVRNNELIERFLAAVRTPDERLGDLDAQLAANRVGAAAVARIVARHGHKAASFYGQSLLDYSHAFMTRAIAAIPSGVYRFDDVMDDDGADTTNIPIRCELRIEGGRAIVDLTKSADQVAGCINCPDAVTRSAVYYCFACLLDEHVPFNAGVFRGITVLTRPGSILHAQYPAAVVAGNTETSQRVVDVVFGALAQALPRRIPAASCGTMSSVALGSAAWTYYETIGGGSGASANAHGASAVQCHMTNTLNTPAEALEIAYPLRVLRFERALNTGGDGNHKGGDGIIRELQALGDCEGTILSDRRTTAPWGLDGATSAQPGINSIHRTDGTKQSLPGKARFSLTPGDVLRIQTPGGGGHDG
jgi:N-methylhydantoinase B